MSNNKIVLKSDGIRALMKDAGIMSVCENIAGGMLNRCGSGYAMEQKVYQTRGGFIVYPDDAEAFYDNLRNNTLLKAVR